MLRYSSFIPQFLVFSFVAMLPAFAQVESGNNVVISEKVDHDLYVAAGTVTINAPVIGDLIVAGGTVNINDSIAQDILMVGGNLLVNGYVGDDIRCAGGTITLSKQIGGDVVVAGGTVNMEEGVIVYGNLLSSGGEVKLDGEVKGSIKNASGTFTLNGKATSDLESRGGKISINGSVDGHSILAANTIELGPDARFNNNVMYWNNEGTLDFHGTITGGQASFDSSLEIDSSRWQYLGFASLLLVTWYLGTALAMIILIQYLFRDTLKNTADTIKETSLKSLGLGFLFLVGVPVLVVVAVISIVGLPLGMLMLLGYVTLLLFATVIISLITANWINNTYHQGKWSTAKLVFSAFGIFILLKLASLTPFIGPLIMLLLICMAIGGILQNVKWKRQKQTAVL